MARASGGGACLVHLEVSVDSEAGFGLPRDEVYAVVSSFDYQMTAGCGGGQCSVVKVLLEQRSKMVIHSRSDNVDIRNLHLHHE